MKIEIENSAEGAKSLQRYLSPLAVWALSFGAAVGWGAFVMPGTTFLPIAGPLGTAIGIAIGAVLMLIIGINYHCLMRRFPDAGGAYSYVKRICNYDHGYLCAWFLILTYLAIAWANATALAVIGRNLLGGIFAVGLHYTIMGYDVFLGEVGLSFAALVLTGAFLLFPRRLGSRIEVAMAIILCAGIAVAFGAAMWKCGGIEKMVTPDFAPNGKVATQVLSIIALAPWAYVGFECVSHSMEEVKFRIGYLVPALIFVLLTAAFSYIALTFVATSTQPAGFANWQEHVANIGKLHGIEGMPVFYGVKAALGKYGLAIMGLAAFAAIVTGLIAHLYAASRLVFSLARDGLLPHWFGLLNKNGTPRNAVIVLVAFSCLVPFLGRTAIGWIVDVTTIGACIAYGYVSYCAFRVAHGAKRRFVEICGILGLAISLAFIVYFLVPSFWTVSTFAEESYFILAGWCIIGFICFRGIFYRDKMNRLGKSTVAWLALLFMIFFSSHMWVRQTTHRLTTSVLNRIGDYYHMELDDLPEHHHTAEEDERVLRKERMVIDETLAFDNLLQMVLVVMALGIMFSIYSTMSRREREAAKAKEYFFSTVSHDIRTPLNAIIGYSQMLKLGFKSKEEHQQAVDSILVSSETLLRLINDILDLSALEAGKVTLTPETTDFKKMLEEIVASFNVATHKKGVELRTKIEPMPLLLIDPYRMRQIAFNLIGNGIKFTEKGFVEVRASFVPDKEGALGTLHFAVQDTGIGISEEDQVKIAAPYVQVTSKLARHGGTGLGLSICKDLINAMGGKIALSSKLGEGSTFRIEIPRIRMKKGDSAAPAPSPLAAAIAEVAGEPAKEAEKPAPAPAAQTPAQPAQTAATETANDAATPQTKASDVAEAATYVASPSDIEPKNRMRLLLVDDSKMNLMVLKALLKKVGNFEVETAPDGKAAYERLGDKNKPQFDAVLTDMWMPEMDGAGLASVIRKHPELFSMPVYVVTADVELQKDYAEKGFDDILLKPVTLDLLKSKCNQILDS